MQLSRLEGSTVGWSGVGYSGGEGRGEKEGIPLKNHVHGFCFGVFL